MTVREYIGARYVPLFMGEWSDQNAYEPLSIVINQGNSYTSRQSVPVGIPITNTQYWALTGNYNAQIEAYRQEVSALDEEVSALDDRVDATEDAISDLNAEFEPFGRTQPINVLTLGIKNDGSEDISAIVNEATANYPLYFPSGQYLVSEPLYIQHSIYGDGYHKLWENDGTTFISAIESQVNNCGVVNVTNTPVGMHSMCIQGISVKCNADEFGFNVNKTQTQLNIFIADCAAWNCKNSGFVFDSATSDSRAIQVSNCAAWGYWDSSAYYDSAHLGFYFKANVPDSKIDNCEAMAFKHGIRADSFIQITNTHVWCGHPHFTDVATQWRDSVAFWMNSDAILSNVYFDTCFLAVFAYQMTEISNAYYYYDNTVSSYSATRLTPFFADTRASIMLENVTVVDRLNKLDRVINPYKNQASHIIVKSDATFEANPILLQTLEPYWLQFTTINEYKEVAKIVNRGYYEFDIGNANGYKATIRASFDSNGTLKYIDKLNSNSSYYMRVYYKISNNITTFYISENGYVQVKPIYVTAANGAMMNYVNRRMSNGSAFTQSTETLANLTEINAG